MTFDYQKDHCILEADEILAEAAQDKFDLSDMDINLLQVYAGE